MPSTYADADLLEQLEPERFIDDPFVAYRALRERPGWRSPSGYRVFAGYADVMEILRQPDIFGQKTRINPSFHEMNPPEHTRLRRLVSRAFTARSVAAQKKMIEEIVQALLVPLRPTGSAEFVESFALRVPAQVIAQILGVPYSDAELWQSWMDVIKESRGVIHLLLHDPEAQREKERAAAYVGEEASRYLLDLIGQRKTVGGDDVVSRLLAAREDDDTLTDDEVLYTLFAILAAGLHTTASQMANMLSIILQTPGALDSLLADRSLIDNAVDEGLRYDGALQAEHRVVREDTRLGAVPLKAGEAVMIVNGAANRDPTVFPLPDEFCLTRSNARDHLSFGWGVHRCLGASLAKAELTTALEFLLDLPGLRIDGVPAHHRYTRWRGLESLQLRWDAT